VNSITPTENHLIEVFRTAARAQIAELDAGLSEVVESAELWAEKKAELCDISHNLKGQGGSFGYPLITQIGLSLNLMLKDLDTCGQECAEIALAHVRALSTVLEMNIKGGGGPGGHALVQRLKGLSGQLDQSSAT